MVSQYEHGPDFQTPNEAEIARLQEENDRLRMALKDIQAKAVGVNPPRHTWYYDRAEEALAAVSRS